MARPLNSQRLQLLLVLLACYVCSAHAAVLSSPTTSSLAKVARLPFKRHGGGGEDEDEHDHESDAVECYAAGVEDWNKGLHIGAIFIVLATSGLGVYLPVLGHYIPQLHIPRTAMTLGKHLGTGVIIATALVHMLPGGYESLGDPCIGGRMGNYGGWPGVLAMMAIFAMHLIEFVLSNHAMGKHGHSHGMSADIHDSTVNDKVDVEVGAAEADSNQTASIHGNTGKRLSLSDSQLDNVEQNIVNSQGIAAPISAGKQRQENCDAVAVHTHHTHVHGASFIENTTSLKNHQHKISTYILELGICLHSVIIGLTLSVTTGTGFKTLLVAIVFHQFCEGLALGSRISEVQYLRWAFARAIISATLFMLVTPLGMVIGIGIRHSYAPSSPSSLITMGVLDSLSAGILLYTGLVNLLAEEFGTLEFRGYRTTKKVACFAATFIGAGIMALIGKWA
ncbi:ZIP zinc/iron transport family [Coemansia reversa NRRL 1564]|uniref:ZIP zinc/iron transport family n=1 Tax=Coemansia reversa (strain ATCC 12441 / NRRL 1564) TaxID=763665 RepID=A0A2G5BFF0_COERN|nr:ZIP zinc/iron transport family [Coemansia reversa NRRL 1564]|eukprot:PIA17746.1 ZIP zinc/iron transport family [Coemansia reversa NRRL 1564]